MVAPDGKIMYISETASVHLGLSQVCIQLFLLQNCIDWLMLTEWQRDLVTSTDVVTRVMTAVRDWTLPGGPGKKKKKKS